ncbi:ATP-NAD kinase family protein [Marinimicrobium alkaliphilum]|uniref:ATP-NAD kinase family protein n=1 Tax=Marinimicrobium alkaliphilum TaxID=2202654 RepID=UPI000DBAC40B|nr:ATP-NAD kinase family protein [Marinimicrobium alkaliphilum]
MFILGVLVNPCAGLGGSVGLKGSDGPETRAEALARGAEARAPERMRRALAVLTEQRRAIRVLTYAGAMGEDSARAAGFEPEVIGAPGDLRETQPEDTRTAAAALCDQGVDLLLFAGGDGTARDIADAVGTRQPVLGVPSGVKMHSGVYTHTPEAAGEVIKLLLAGQLVPIAERDVRDIDEEAFREGQVRARHYASLMAPEEPQFVQHTKNAGAEVDELTQLDAAAELIEQLDDETLYIVGPGSTTQVFMRELGQEGSLLGVDLLHQQALIARDVTAQAIRDAMDEHVGPVKIIVTAIGGQGHIIGRGNQQLAPDILVRVGRENLMVLATREKILALDGRPLLIDSNDPQLDKAWRGFLPVITGYHERVLYPVGY